MKYGIITVDDSRKDYRNAIENSLSMERVWFDCVDARVDGFEVETELERVGLAYKPELWPNHQPKIGEIGCWLSHYKSWKKTVEAGEPLMVFEDDAILPNNFEQNVMGLIKEVPPYYDYISLCIPPTQVADYMWMVHYGPLGEPRIVGQVFDEKVSQFYIGSKRMARLYQTWGSTAAIYSPTGAEKLIDLASDYGVHAPVDCFIIQHAHMNELNAFAPKPEFSDLVAQANFEIESTIQEKDLIR